MESYLNKIGQPWREDSSNRQLTFTRNRIRHELLPLLETWNPQLREHLAQMASLAREEDTWWRAELARISPQLLLSGRPVRGGGRASGDGLALDVTRLAALPVALQRRLLRFVASKLGASCDYAATESLRTLAASGKSGQKIELAQGLRAERTPREIRFSALPLPSPAGIATPAEAEYLVPVPGEVCAPIFGIRIQIAVSASSMSAENSDRRPSQAVLRNWKPGDRVTLRYSSGPHKVKEVLERLRVTGSGRSLLAVLEVGHRIVWMKGVELEPMEGIKVVSIDQQCAPDHPVHTVSGPGTPSHDPS